MNRWSGSVLLKLFLIFERFSVRNASIPATLPKRSVSQSSQDGCITCHMSPEAAMRETCSTGI